MSLTAVDGAQPAAVPPREWWQVWAQWRVRWWESRPTLRRRVALMRTVGLWLALGYVVVGLAFAPGLRLGVQAWLGACWVAVAWFFMARTKTLTWSGFMRFFALCGAWSVLVGLVLARVSSWSSGGVFQVGAGVYSPGPSVFLAGVGEEALKLVPLVVLVLVAPRRVSRFAAVDFALLGIAAGAAFVGVEETARRARLSSGSFASSAVPEQWVQFGVWPIPSGLASGFAGHVVSTGLVGAAVGLGVAVWRAARGRRAVVVWRCLAVAGPVLVLVAMMADHVVCNAKGFAADGWLDPGVSAAPWWLRVPWHALGHGQYRPLGLVVLFAACLAVDAFRLAARPGAALVAQQAWRPVAQAGASLSAWHARSRWAGKMLANTLNGAVAALWVGGRDLGQLVAAHARGPGERRLDAVRRGAAAASAQRALREAGMEHHAGLVHPWRQRVLAVGLLTGLLVAALVVAPDLVAHTGPGLHRWDHAWLACTLDMLSQWWSSLSPAQQIAVGAGAAALVVLSGGSLTLAMGVSGVAVWGLDKASGIATFTRDPSQATSDYFANATPAQLAADTLGIVLTFAPGNFAGAATARATRAAATRFADDPAAALARARTHMDDTGSAQIPGRRPGADEPRSTGRTAPGGANEERAMDLVQENPQYGDVLPVHMKDPQWPAEEGWEKMSQTVDGIEIHYVHQNGTDLYEDFKFKDWSGE